MRYVPEWLKPGLTITVADRNRLAELSSNWIKLHSSLAGMTELDVLKTIVLEYETNQRPTIIGRLKTRFDRMRSLRENADLFKVRVRE
jgi:hypothetical protein